jgi:ABC-2 type transport system ATP-binding protein
MEMLSLIDVHKQFSTQKAVDGVSLSIERGQIFGLLGPNGAGKTTILRMITGIFHPDQGEVLLDGLPFVSSRDQMTIGYMPEERGLYKQMKIGEQILFLGQLKGLSKKQALFQAKQWFERLQMESWWNKKMEDLSKGMSQKLQFVATVLHEPKLIILDEPFSGLDPVNANLIKDEIFNLAKQGATIIFSTHRMEQVEEICDHIALIHQGKKILDGTVHQVKQDFKENIFRIGVTVIPEQLMTYLFEVKKYESDELLIRLSEGVTTNEVLAYFIQHQIPIRSFNEVLPSLNDIFIRLVHHQDATRSFQQINHL